MTHPSNRDLTKGRVLSQMLRLSLPMGWGIMAIISFSLVDTWFISRLGTSELAAMGFIMPVTMVVFNVIFALSIAMSSVIARKIGQGNGEDVRSIATIGLGLVVMVALFCAVLGNLSMPYVFAAMGAGDAVMVHVRDYLLIWLYGAIFLGLPIIANAAIRGAGDTFWPAFVMTCVAIVNAILSPLLIFGLFGFPRLEMQGAALSTVISYAISAVIALSILHFREGFIRLPAYASRACWGLATRALAVIAVPVALASMILPVLGGVLNAWVAQYGDAAVAGFGVAVRIETFILIPAMALGAGIAPLAGQNWGAGRMDRLSEAITLTTRFCVLYGLFSAVLLIAFAGPLARVFTTEPLAVQVMISFLSIVPIGYVGLFYLQTMGAVFNAVGKPVRALAVNVLKAFGLILPLVWVGRMIADIEGMMVGIAVSHILAALIIWAMVRRITSNNPKSAQA